ncbi:MAG: hypothetical protein WBW53_12285 [Terriglobales bacterium]
MAENPHYKEPLQLLNEFDVEYLIVGGFAVMKYGEPRYAKDLDVWVFNSAQNSARLVKALKKFGAPSNLWNHRTDIHRETSRLSDRSCSGAN